MRLSGDASDQPQVALEREALTAKMETVPLKLGLRVALVGEGFRQRLCQNQKCILTSVLRPPGSLWTFNCNFQPTFLLHPYLSLAVLRLHDTMTTINLDCVEFCQPPSRAERTDKNPMVILQHKGETAADTGDRDAVMWNPA